MKPANILQKRASLLIFFSALGIRISVVLGYAFGFFNGGLKGGDTILYLQIARNLLGENGFAVENGPTAFVAPVYPMFLAACIYIFGENPLYISIVQSILSSLVCVIVYKIATTVFEDSKIAFLAGIIAAVYFELVLWSNAQLLTEPLYVFFFAISILLLVRALNKTTYLYFAASGAVFALAALTRPTAIGIVFGISIILLVSSFFRSRIKWKHSLLFFAMFLTIMLPWGIRNYLVFDSFTISSLEGGHVLWLGNNSQYDLYEHPDFAKFGGYTVMFKVDKKLAGKLANHSSVEQNTIFANAALSHIKSNPLAFMKRAFHKNWNMWRPNFSQSSWRNGLISYTFYPTILLTSLLGMFLAWQKQREKLFEKLSSPIGLLISIFLMHLAIHSIITGEIRFRVPLWVILIPFSAYTFSIIFKRLRLKFFKPT